MKNILQGIGVVFTLIASFLGLMYFLKGDLLISSLVSLVIVVIEYFLIEQFIKAKAEISKNRLSVLSVILWGIYIMLAIPMTLFLVHALNVEINAKKDIQKIANQKMGDLDAMVRAYENKVDAHLTNFRIKLQPKLAVYAQNQSASMEAELRKPPFNLTADDLKSLNSNNVPRKVKFLSQAEESLLMKPVNDSISNAIRLFKARYGGVFDNWSRMHLNYAFYELDNLLQKNYESLQRTYSNLVAEKFEYDFTKDETYMSDPLSLLAKHKPYSLIIVILLFHTLILLPYFIEPVSGRYVNNKIPRTGGGLEI